MTLVFVYGTLKRGHGNHTVMQWAGGKLVGPATRNCAQLYRVAGFPGLVETNNPDDVVIGELYMVDDLSPLDGLEGYRPENENDSMYLRRSRNVMTVDGWEVMSHLYVWNESVDPETQPLIEGGCY